MVRQLVWIGLAAALAACGKSAIPAERLGRAESAVRVADESGARAEPTAALHLRLASDELTRAKRMIAEGDMDRASFVLLRAESDAEVARSLARESKAKQDAARAQEEIRTMQGSIQGGP